MFENQKIEFHKKMHKYFIDSKFDFLKDNIIRKINNIYINIVIKSNS